jgi:hypothetical protein
LRHLSPALIGLAPQEKSFKFKQIGKKLAQYLKNTIKRFGKNSEQLVISSLTPKMKLMQANEKLRPKTSRKKKNSSLNFRNLHQVKQKTRLPSSP